ncbi:MAG: hypothetical protein SGILL_006190 [Bacillariaceae sp.]
MIFLILLLATILLLLLPSSPTALAFSPLSLLKLQPKQKLKSTTVETAKGDIRKLLAASNFFVDAFWTGKIGGGSSELSDKQQRQLSSLQFSEFRKRYAGVGRGPYAELLLCYGEVTVAGGGGGTDNDSILIGCAGMEVQEIAPPDNTIKKQPNGISNPVVRAPLMSNVAVSKDFRRRGIGLQLVKEAENIAQYQWGFTDMYLFVEQRNKSAIRLYQKLGYSKQWIDANAKTLLPKGDKLEEDSTKIVCMKKRLDLNAFSRVLFSILGR